MANDQDRGILDGIRVLDFTQYLAGPTITRFMAEMGAQIILGNTFHLWMRPGLDVLKQFGGLHRFEAWSKPILTDSGGFQVWSLGEMRKISEEGVKFASPVNGDRLLLTPEESMRIQRVLDSDIAMVFDECIEYPADRELAAMAAHPTTEWARRCRDFARAQTQDSTTPAGRWTVMIPLRRSA